MSKHDFTGIQWGQEFVADSLTITGEGELKTGDVVLIAFHVSGVDYYPHAPNLYQAKLQASSVVPNLQVKPSRNQPNLFQRGIQWVLGGFV